MSNLDNSGQLLVNKLKQISNYLNQCNNSNKNEIIIEKKLVDYHSDLVDLVNNFVIDLTIELNNKIPYYLQSFTIYRIILNKFNLNEICIDIYHDYVSLYIFLKTNFAYQIVDTDKYSGLTIGIILEEILSGNIYSLEEIPRIKINDSKSFKKKITSYLNLLQTTYSVYNALLYHMKVYYMDDLEQWTNNIFKTLELTIDIIENYFDPYKLIKLSDNKENSENIVTNSLNIIIILNDMDIIFKKLISLYNNKWGNNIQQNLIKDFTVESFYSLHIRILNNSEKIISNINNLYSDGILDKQIKLEENIIYFDYQIVHYDNLWLSEIYKFYINNKTRIQIYDESNITVVNDIINAGELLINYIVNNFENKEEFTNSYYYNSVINSFISIMPFYALHALYTKNLQYFTDKVNNIAIITGEIKNSTLISIIYLCELFIFSKLNLEIDFSEIFSKVYHNLQTQKLKPQEYLLSITILINISIFIEIDINIDNLFDLGKEYGIIAENNKLVNEFLHYRYYIKDPLLYPVDNSLYRLELIPFDYTTFIIPDLTQYYKKIGEEPRIFIPFYRISDMIIDD